MKNTLKNVVNLAAAAIVTSTAIDMTIDFVEKHRNLKRDLNAQQRRSTELAKDLEALRHVYCHFNVEMQVVYGVKPKYTSEEEALLERLHITPYHM